MCASCGPECLHAGTVMPWAPCSITRRKAQRHAPCSLHASGLREDNVEGPGMRILQAQLLKERVHQGRDGKVCGILLQQLPHTWLTGCAR